jgi:hypothetical protein
MAHQDSVHYRTGKGVAHRIEFSVHGIRHRPFLHDALFVVLQPPERPACLNCYLVARDIKQQMVLTLLAHPGGYFSLALRLNYFANIALMKSTS